MEKSARRWWPPYSLRTLFVLVTLLACWLGYMSNWIRQRHALLERHREFDRSHEKEGYIYGYLSMYGCGGPQRSLPWSLRLLGEQSHSSVRLQFVCEKEPSGDEFKDELALARGLFPEAHVAWDAEFPTSRFPDIDEFDESGELKAVEIEVADPFPE